MNDIPLCELNALRRIQAQFDGAYVSLLTKLSQLNPELEHEQEEQSETMLTSQQGDQPSVTITQSSDDEECESNGDTLNGDHVEDTMETSEFPQTSSLRSPSSFNPELVSLAVNFAKLLNKSLLATERATQLERQVCVLQREVCTLRAIANQNHKMCATASQDVAQGTTGHKSSEVASKMKLCMPYASNLIAFKAAVEQEVDCLIEAQNKAMQAQERKYKNQIFGLHLAVDYLRKEIAGRIQQMQIYEAVYGTTAEVDEKRMNQLSHIWTQLMCEIALNRHKTIVRLANLAKQEEEEEEGGDQEMHNLCTLLASGCVSTGPRSINYTQFGQVHYVSIFIEKGKSIGLWIGGGAEHEMPLIISKVEDNSVAAACGNLFAGDIILSIQNFDMIGTTQAYAVQLLKSLSGWCRMGIVRIPVSNVEEILANREDFNFELMYDDVPAKKEEEATATEQEQSEPVESIDATEDDEETDTASESETFTEAESE